MSDTFIIDHGTIITIMLMLMFAATIAYTVWVIVLDIREQREHDAADREWSGTMRGDDHDGGNA